MMITLPDPSLVLLLGVSGSGKSTFARAHFVVTEILSSDHCRALVCDDENDQRVNKEAFAILHLIAASRLTYNKLTVIDATNVQAEARAQLLAIAQRHHVPAVALVFNFDVELCLQRNAQRVQRVVPHEVVLQQQHDLQQSLAALPDEGFHAIYTLASPAEVAALTIQRKKSCPQASESL
ncbi:MAG TPA: AAA family ATPase [Blastocatellia bacterium]|nr:AAA family ATPase [Blastocatellia bacterium]